EELMKIEKYNYDTVTQLIKKCQLNKKDIEIERNNLTFEEINRLLDFARIDENFIRKLLDNLSIDFFKVWIENCNDTEQIGTILDLIDYIYREMSEELLNELSLDDLLDKMNNSNNMEGINLILRTVTEISYSKGEELVNRITNEKVLELVKQANDLSNISIFYAISLIDEKRVEKLIAVLHEDYFQAFINVQNHSQIYYLIWILESYSKSETKRLIERVTLSKIEEVVRNDKEIDSDSLAGIIEILGRVSQKKALEFVDLVEDIILNIAKNAKEAGDVGDFLVVIGELSQERAKSLIDKLTIEIISKSMGHIRGIAYLLKVIDKISKEDAEKLAKEFGLEKIKEKVKHNWKNCHAALRLIEAMDSISFEFGEYVIADLDIKYLKKLTTCNRIIDWYLQLVNKHSSEKAKKLVQDHNRLEELFDYNKLEFVNDLFTVLIEIDKENFYKFIEKLTFDKMKQKLEYELKDARSGDSNFGGDEVSVTIEQTERLFRILEPYTIKTIEKLKKHWLLIIEKN
ncbi:MAG: hypothetical protein ACTSPM_07465, partial [Candidatus Heimdallarchaeota archaeon]